MGSGTQILPGIERGAQAGIEPATGAWSTQQIGSAKAVRNISTPVHSSAGTSPWAQCQSRIGPGTQPRCESGSPRHRAEGAVTPRSVVEPIKGFGSEVFGVRTAARSSDPASGDRERQPGGHRARHGRLVYTAGRLTGSWTDHVHTVALEVSNVTLAVSRRDSAEWRSPPWGGGPLGCMCVDIECPGLAEPRVTCSSATMAGSMPAGRRFVREADVTGRSFGCERALRAPRCLRDARGQRLAKAGQKGRRGEGGPGSGWWVPVPPRGPLTQSCPAVSGEVERPRDAGSLNRSPIAFRRNLVGAGTTAVMLAVTVLLRREGDVRPIAT